LTLCLCMQGTYIWSYLLTQDKGREGRRKTKTHPFKHEVLEPSRMVTFSE
jgi:hypothetical protein